MQSIKSSNRLLRHNSSTHNCDATIEVR